MSGKVESKLDKELHHAAAIGSSKLVQKILDSGKVHVDCQDEEGISALMLGTANNRLNCVKILLQEGADPQLKSKDGTCAIFLAARCGYSQILAILLENCSQKSFHLSDHGASNGVAKMCQIKNCSICDAGQEFLKQEEAENQNKNQCKNMTSDQEKDSVKNPPVCTGVTSDQREKDSLKNPPVCTNGTSDHEEYSAQNPKVNSPGSPPGNLPGNTPGNPPLCTNGTSHQEEYSAQNPKVNSPGNLPGNTPGNPPGNSPGNPPLCTKLTSGQPHFSNSLARKDGITPLIMAAAMNHDLCVDLLLSAGVDPNEESKIGSTALFHACLRGHVKAAKRLICDPRINLRLLRNGETCLHAATISGNPELVQLLLEKTTTDDALLTNASGQNPLDLLIMFINYGNISLTSNLLKVLNLLSTSTTDVVTTPSSPKKASTTNSTHKEVPSPISNISQEEMQKLRKLVRIYCPFNFNHATKEMIACSAKPNKSQQSMKKTGGSLPSSVMSRSLNGSPLHKNGKNGNNHHVRFTPDAEKKSSEMAHSEMQMKKASSLFWLPSPKIQRAQCKMLTTDELMKSMKKSPTKIFLSKLNGESEIRNH